jgi:predicted secreted protein
MTGHKGKAFLLKDIEDASSLIYQTVGGFKTIDISKSVSGSISLTGHGVFTGIAAATQVRNNALKGAANDYELSFPDCESMRGKFLITRLDYAGDFNGEPSYTISLESTGEATEL